MRKTMMVLACLMLAAPAWSQDANANMRHPTLVQVGDGQGALQVVVGDEAWGDVLATLIALQSADISMNQEIVDLLWARRDINPPVFLFEVARRTADLDPDRALEVYFLGRSRTIYDAARCVDPTALAVVGEAASQAGPALNVLMSTETGRMEAALSRVIESGQAFTGQASPWWACSFGNAAYFAAVNDADMPGAEWLKVEGVWPALRGAITNNMNANLATVREGRLAQAQQ